MMIKNKIKIQIYGYVNIFLLKIPDLATKHKGSQCYIYVIIIEIVS